MIFALEEEVLLLLTEEREECYLVVRGEVLIVQEEAPKGPVFQRVRWRWMKPSRIFVMFIFGVVPRC